MSRSGGERRAVAYLRAAVVEPAAPVLDSSSRDDLDAQRCAIEGWATREGVAIASWQVDVGVHGATPIAERPGLLAAYRALFEHRADMLVAANAERFSLDELVSWLIERAALSQGATVHTADGSRGSSRVSVPPRPDAEQELAWTRGAIDLARAHERVTVRQRIRAALAERRARGLRVGNVPYGFRLASDGVHIEPDATEQAVVDVVRQLHGEGLSQRAIARELAARGVAGRTGAPLRQTQVAKILRVAS